MTPEWLRRLAGPAGDPDLVGACLRLAASAWVTPDRLRDAVAQRLDAGGAVDAAAVVGAVEAAATPPRRLAEPADVEAWGRSLLAAGARMAVVGQPGYPPRLADAWPELGAPLWLFVRCDAGDLAGPPAVAVVGTRQPTLDGLRTAGELASLLARNGVTVVSGLARGIDQAAHRGALAAGGATVGVLGTGFGVDYPCGDGALRDAVAAAGGLVTELLPGVPPRPAAFLWRNRIVSGLADATVVVEGRTRSGALHTARLAAAQGRDVLAVPGSIHAPASRAPLDLIRDGATPLTRLDDVLEPLGLDPAPPTATIRAAATPRGLDPVAADVLALLSVTPASVGALAARSGHPLPAVLAAAADLDARGLAAAGPRGVQRR